MEQLGPLGVFGGLQLLQLCELVRRRADLTMSAKELFNLRAKVSALSALECALSSV